MRFFSAFLLVLLIAAPIAPVRAGDAASLMAKHRAFVGWQSGDPAMQDQVYSEHQTVTAQDKTYHNDGQIRRHDLLLREVVTYSGGGGEDEGFDGHMFWQSNQNGYVHPQLGVRAETSYDYDLVMDEAVTLIPNPELQGSDTIDGTPVTIVRVKPPNSLPMDVYVGADGAFKRVIIDPDGSKAVLNILSYINAGNGRKLIGEYQWSPQPPWKISDVQTNVRLLPADVNPPAPQATWTFANSNPFPIEFDSHTFTGNAIVVKALLNGHEGRFLIDSGAGDIFVSDAFAESAGLKARSKLDFSGIASHATQGGLILIDSLQIGGNTLHHVYAVRGTSDMKDTDGILGYDFFAGAVVDVDLNRHTISIHDPSSYQPTVAKGAYGFGVDLATLQPGVTIKLPGNLVAHPIFDSGDDFFMMLPEHLRKTGHLVGLDDEVDTDYGSFSIHPSFIGVDGAIGSTNCMRLANIQVGPYSYDKAPLCFIESASFGNDGGLIGFDFLKHFNWTFDYPNNMVILTPNGN
jgi:hypothetical protein